MSYDLRLMRPVPGVSLEDADYWLSQVEESELNEEPRPAGELLTTNGPELRDHLAKSLLAMGCGLTGSPAADSEGRYEVDHADLGLQISISDQSVEITIPYWHKGAAGKRAIDLIFKCLRVLQQEGSLRVYDPQLGRELDVRHDLHAVVTMYAQVADRFDEQTPDRAPRPWWKFWA